jgi:hypothetical protein
MVCTCHPSNSRKHKIGRSWSRPASAESKTPSPKRTGGMAQVVEHLSSKPKAVNSNPSTTKIINNNNNQQITLLFQLGQFNGGFDILVVCFGLLLIHLQWINQNLWEEEEIVSLNVHYLGLDIILIWPKRSFFTSGPLLTWILWGKKKNS